MSFRLISGYKPTGDQPQAIEKLVAGINAGAKHQVLLGVTGSGKTFTMANLIDKVQKPTLVIAHNKTLAAQLYQEFKEFFPDNAVSYFVSYYDFYQPEAYIPQTDTYIEKETEINEEIDKLRLQTTTNLLTRKDTIVVASVSAIYNLGSPVEYGRFILELSPELNIDRKIVLERLADLQYDRSDFDFRRGTFRVSGDIVSVYPAYEDYGIRIEFNPEGTQVKQLIKINPLTGEKIEVFDKPQPGPAAPGSYRSVVIYPAKHYMTDPQKYTDVFKLIRSDLDEQVKRFQSAGKILEAQRIKSRVTYDLEMIAEVGYVNGIENYSRYFDGRNPGDPPYSLLEYFPKDYLLIIDESHMTVPQIRGMYNGDRSRKQTLIDYGFRLPAALDNRPLRFDEFVRRMGQTVYTSATPDEWEISQSEGNIIEQLVRPTGLVDPEVEIKKTEGQITDLIEEIKKRVEKKERVLVTTLTKRMAEELTDYLNEHEKTIKVAYLHSDVENIERTNILRQLRLGEYDVVVGINLLREGLDLPEVSLVAILDADKEGFLRSRTSLIQTMGRAARHIHGKVIMYADNLTRSMDQAVKENNRRREYQLKWNKDHHITPVGISKPIRENVLTERKEDRDKRGAWGNRLAVMLDQELGEIDITQLTPDDKNKLKKVLEKRMKESAKILDFEGAAYYRDKIKSLDKED
ncbi:excinuclease ABC subunit UvrB [Patescibacteria group bacterium]|nr:excinuclease ABC subunit UvrB [Patescibacteria group bacterium]